MSIDNYKFQFVENANFHFEAMADLLLQKVNVKR